MRGPSMAPAILVCAAFLVAAIPERTAAAAQTGAAAPAAAAVNGTILLKVDATEAARHLFHIKETIPSAAGAVTLVYPKWIPGEHGPTGPLDGVIKMVLTSGGKTLPWKRDPADMYLIHVDVPTGPGGIEAELDFVTPTETEGFTSGASATPQLAMISWNQVLLYPAGPKSDDIRFQAELRLPAGWFYGTALETDSGPPAGGPAPGSPAPEPAGEHAQPVTVRFKPVSLTQLVDSPVLSGAHFRTMALSPANDPRPAFLDMAADSEAALLAKPEVLDAFRRLVAEAVALYGARHYDRYHFLLTLSDHTAHFGLEHHQSSDDRVHERTLLDDDLRLLHADLLSHEMTHSWNGKFRRPAGLATPDYRQPMDGSMLWAYEGLTNYLGWLLGARAGLMTPEQSRDHLASIAAMLDNRGGKAWRPVEDTGTAAQILYGSPDAWQSQRRSVDFYDEGTLIWLEADTIIRQATGGKKSLDDFCKLFLGGTDSSPMLQPYVADDVYSALNRVAEHDWKQFFTERVQQIHPRAPLGGVEASGWRLGWSEEKGPRVRAREDADAYEITDELFSLGFDAHKDGALIDVLTDSPAARAGLAPGMKLVAVDGRRYSRKVLEDALRLGKGSGQPVALLAENGEFFRTFDLDWSAGLRFPKLERDSAKPDLLEEIMRPHAK
jgi:predicted metalloprotease with PDZ domain